MRRAAWIVTAAAALGLALPSAYLAIGGDSASEGTADPCATRTWETRSGVADLTEQIALSAFDGMACDLRVSREAVVLALASPDARRDFVTRQAIADTRFEEAARAGLRRAVDDAERVGALGATRAELLRRISGQVPVDLLLQVISRLV